MPVRRFQPPGAGELPRASFDRVSQVIDELAPLEQFPLRAEAQLNVAAGSFTRLAPRSAGQNVMIPRASAANFGQTITLFVKSSAGALRVRAVDGTINGETSVSFGARITAVIVLVSDGDAGWACATALDTLPAIPAGTVLGNPAGGTDPDVVQPIDALDALPAIPAGTVLGNPAGGTDPDTAQALTGVQVGEIMRWSTVQTISLSPGGTFANVTIDENANIVRFTNGGATAIVESIAAPARAGQVFFATMATGGGDETIFLPEVSTATDNNRIETPGDIPFRIADHLYALFAYVDTGARARWVIIGPPSGTYARTEQSISAAGAVTTLEPAATAVSFSNTRAVIDSINGGTDTGRLLYCRFVGTGPHTVKHNGAGGGTEADIICPGNTNKLFNTRGSFLLRAIGSSGWTMLYGTSDPVVGTSNLGVSTGSATDQRIAQITIGGGTVYEGMIWEFFGAMRVSRGATNTAMNNMIRFECPLGTAQLNSGNIVLNTTNGFTGAVQIRGTITFGAPGATCPIYVAGEIIQTATAAAPAIILPTPSLVATVDTTADFGMAIEGDSSAGVAGTARVPVAGYIRQVF
jgi:hypothetical protein